MTPPRTARRCPSFIRIAAPNGDVAQLEVKKWVGNGAPQYPQGFQQDFNTHYVDPQEGYKRITDLAALNPDIAEVTDLPNKTPGYQRKAQTVVGISTLYAGTTTAPSATEQARAVVVTSKAWGHEGGNDVAIRLVNPGAGDEPMFVGVNGSMIRVNLATDASGAITSTAKDVVDAINANAAAAALVTAEHVPHQRGRRRRRRADHRPSSTTTSTRPRPTRAARRR